MSNHTNSKGHKIFIEHYIEDESQPTIVFLHDSLGCVQLWRDFPNKIAAQAKCNLLVYDRLGYGKSDSMDSFERPINYLEIEADRLSGLLTQLNIQNAILFGHSDGGSIALIAASKYPDKIKAIICEAAHIFVENITLKGINETVSAYENTNLPERLKKYHGDKVDTIFKAWSKTWTTEVYKNWNIEHFLPQITCPLLFIQGEADEYGTLDQVNKTVEQVSGISEKFILPYLGHTPHKESPESVIKKVVDFIECHLK